MIRRDFLKRVFSLAAAATCLPAVVRAMAPSRDLDQLEAEHPLHIVPGDVLHCTDGSFPQCWKVTFVSSKPRRVTKGLVEFLNNG